MILQHITVANASKLLGPTHKLQAMETSADNWCEENRAKLNIDKTKVALLGSRQKINKMTDTEKIINIFINDTKLEQITHVL